MSFPCLKENTYPTAPTISYRTHSKSVDRTVTCTATDKVEKKKGVRGREAAVARRKIQLVARRNTRLKGREAG